MESSGAAVSAPEIQNIEYDLGQESFLILPATYEFKESNGALSIDPAREAVGHALSQRVSPLSEDSYVYSSVTGLDYPNPVIQREMLEGLRAIEKTVELSNQRELSQDEVSFTSNLLKGLVGRVDSLLQKVVSTTDPFLRNSGFERSLILAQRYTDGDKTTAKSTKLERLDSPVKFPVQVETNWRRAWSSFHNRQFHAAKIAFEELLSGNPEVKDYRLGLVECQKQLGDYELAGQELVSLIRSNPSDLNLRQDLGVLKIRSGQFSAAKKIFTKLVQSHPRNSAYRFNLGVVELRTGHSDLAEKHFDQAIKIADARGVAPNPHMLAAKAHMLWEREEPIEALKTISKGIDSSEVPSSMMLLRRAGFYEELERDDECLADLKQACEVDPENPEVHSRIAAFYIVSGEAQDALTSYRQALELDPQNYKLLLGLAEAYRELDMERECFAAHQKASELTDWSYSCHLEQAKSFLHFANRLSPVADKMLNDPESCTSTSRLITLHALDETPLWQMALSYYEAASNDFKHALNSRPKDDVALFYLGLCEHLSLRPESAISYYDKAIEAQPLAARNYYNRGYAYILDGFDSIGKQDLSDGFGIEVEGEEYLKEMSQRRD